MSMPRPFLALAVGAGLCLANLPGVSAAPPRYDHVVIVIEENRADTQIIGDLVNAPYLNSLASNGVILGSIFAIEHPSQPNYLQLFSGSNQGVLDDNLPPNFSTTPTGTYPFTTPNLGAEIIAAGFTFAGYCEELESAGATDWADYDPHSATHPGITYRRKHNPWANWVAKALPLPANQLTGTVNRAFTQFPTNFNLLPTVSFVVPNQLHDMHDGSRKQGDDWLAANLNAYAVWARTNNSLLIVTWDEDDYNQDNEIPTVLYGANLRNGTVTPGTWTLHNLLRTIEDMYGSTNHAGAAAQVRSIVGPFTTDPALTVATFRQGLNGYGNARDTQLWEETPTTSYATAQDLTADLDTGAATGDQQGQVLVRFDALFGAGPGQIPTNATILSAKLLLHTPINTTGTDYDSDDTFRAHRMIADWADTATWNSVGAGISVDNVEAAGASSFSVVPDVDGGPTIFDVTADLELFQTGTANRGWVIRPSSGGTGDGWTFKSSDYVTDPALRPTLEVVYTAPVTVPAATVTFSPAGAVWRYLDNGTDQGTAWRSNSFNDTGWSNGPAMLGYGDANGTFPRTTNSFGPDGANKYITTYYRRPFFVPNVTNVQSLSARLQRDDGAVVYLNGAEVWRNNMPAGTITYLTRAAATVSGAAEATWFVNALSAGSLQNGTNVLAVEIHQDATNSSDIAFDLELTGSVLFPSLPPLTMTRTAGSATFQWPLAACYFGLQYSTNLAAATWFNITNAPALSNGQWTVILPAPAIGQRFYRLQSR